MYTPMSTEEILEKLPPSYHHTFKRVQQEYIQPEEHIYLAAHCTKIDRPDESGYSHPSSNFILITSYRWIRAGMNWSGKADAFVYRKTGFIGGGLVEEKLKKWWWYFPPPRLPTTKEQGKKSFSERVGEYIRVVPLVELARVTHKFGYTKIHKDKEYNIVELHLKGDGIVAFYKDDGEKLYSLLEYAYQTGGRIDVNPSVSASNDDQNYYEMLKQLKLMLDDGLITEEQYDQKRAEILDLM